MNTAIDTRFDADLPAFVYRSEAFFEDLPDLEPAPFSPRRGESMIGWLWLAPLCTALVGSLAWMFGAPV